MPDCVANTLFFLAAVIVILSFIGIGVYQMIACMIDKLDQYEYYTDEENDACDNDDKKLWLKN